MGKIQRMLRLTLHKKISPENQRNCIQKLRKICNSLWKRDMVPRPERNMKFCKELKELLGEICVE